MNSSTKITAIPSKRDHALDFVKGFLVEIMIIYHILNYFFSARPPILLYIDFVTGSFVFITGYLISSLYNQKYDGNSMKIFSRLFSRGVKLLILFLVINIIVYVVAPQNYNGYQFKLSQFFSNLDLILIRGSAKYAVFELLVPIAYTLIVSSLLLIIVRNRYFISLSIVPFISTSILFKQDVLFNIYFISIGLAGLVCGYFSKTIQQYSLKKTSIYISIVFVIIYCLIINIWGRDNILLYLFGVLSVLYTVYSFSSTMNLPNIFIKTFDIFGRYTLICYLSQILFLQILSRLISNTFSLVLTLLIAFVATNLFLYLLCKLITQLCNWSKLFNKIYLLIFG